MGASAAGIPSSPNEPPRQGLRASDAERDEVMARLREEYIAGRLSHDTFVYRMDSVLQARQRADLPPLLADLPARSPARRWPITGWLRGVVSRLTGSDVPADPRPDPVTPPPSAPPPSAPSLPAPARVGPAAVRPTVGMGVAGDLPSPLPLRFPRAEDGEFSIGRDAGCDLAIADMTVSRRHATLERTPDGWLISDLASTNGTRVNGWRVKGKVAVRPGDLISFGSLEAVFAHDDRDNAVPPPVPPTAPPTLPPAGSPAPRP